MRPVSRGGHGFRFARPSLEGQFAVHSLFAGPAETPGYSQSTWPVEYKVFSLIKLYMFVKQIFWLIQGQIVKTEDLPIAEFVLPITLSLSYLA